MRLKDLAGQFTDALHKIYGEEEAQAIFLVSIDQVMQYSRADYLLKKEEEVPAEPLEQLQEVLSELSKGRPVQYVLGETVFYGSRFQVNESVLIPRPETEELVDWVFESSKSLSFVNNKPIYLLDVGTGSGCIAVSLKKNLPAAEVFALDISKEALSIANINSYLNQVDIHFIHTDIRGYNTPQKFDLIVSNPPYIRLNEGAIMSENVLAHEPHLALFVSNEDPLIFYNAIADFALTNLSNSGLLFFEINEHLGKETVDLLIHKDFINIELRRDMQGKERMIRCQNP